MMCYKHGEDEVKLERGLRVWKMEDICFIFFKVESESGGFQIKSSLWVSNLMARSFFHLETKEETDFGQACIWIEQVL